MVAPLKDTIEEVSPKRISHDQLHTCWDPFEVDEFDLDRYVENMHTLSEPPNFSTTPPWTEKYELLPEIPTPITLSLESPLVLELKPPSIIPEYVCIGPYDMLPVISALDLTPNLETQFRSILEEYIKTNT